MQDELFDVADRLEQLALKAESPTVKVPLDQLEEAARQVGKAWSGSWLGYHTRVYYEGLIPPPPGARFSQEWGLDKDPFIRATVGDWCEYDYDAVKDAIEGRAGNPDISHSQKLASEAQEAFEDAKEEVLSILTTLASQGSDSFIERLRKEAENLRLFSRSDFVDSLRPKGKFMTRDTLAMGQGFLTPPHIGVIAEVSVLRTPSKACSELAKVARRAASHISRLERKQSRSKREMGTSVFIGHGGSRLWKDLKDFIQDRIGLPWDEFNRVPVAGVTNIERLTQMLDDAAIAFLVLTAEDEQSDGKMHARLNVIHEAGLFQGRLGFTRAIVLLEEGCEEFSNIQGLGQIRFPKGNIAAAFEEVRRVLEREELIA